MRAGDNFGLIRCGFLFVFFFLRFSNYPSVFSFHFFFAVWDSSGFVSVFEI